LYGDGALRSRALPAMATSSASQRRQLVRVVGEQQQRRRDAEQRYHVRDLVVAAVVAHQPHAVVRLEGGQTVAARLHDHAIARLRAESGAASLLHQVEDHAAARIGDARQRELELIDAVAVTAAVGLAGDARRVHARQHRLAAAQVAVCDRERIATGGDVLEHVRREVAVHGGERRRTAAQHLSGDVVARAAHGERPGSRFSVLMTRK
jgi:hypothetical protein